MGIAPNTELYLLKGIPLDSDYTNTIKFETENKQRQFFTANNRVIKHFYNSVDMVTKAMSYIQKDDGVLCVGLTVSQCFNCNYIAFKNNSHEDKWFYAFVTKVEYANEKSCYIHYQIDVMQTWMFDYNLGMSFIERQHHPTDRIGENRVPENLECGDYICNEKYDYDLSKMCVALITSKELPKLVFDNIFDNVPETNFLDLELAFGKGESPSGVYNSLFYYSGFIMQEDFEYFKTNLPRYNIQTTRSKQTANSEYVPATLDEIIRCIVDGKIDGFNETSIVAVYQYPAWFHKKDTNIYTKKGVKGKRFTLDFSQTIDGYSVKNNKLLTSPYSFIRCSNNAGTTADYNFENFNYTPYSPTFQMVGTLVNPPCIMSVPTEHRGLDDDFDSGLVLNSFPMCSYVGDAYSRWITENKSALTMSLLTTVIGTVIGVATGNAALGVATSSVGKVSAVAGIAGAISGGVGNVGSKLGKISDLKNTPPAVYGQTQCEALNCGIDRVKFTYYHMTIRPEFARIIDDYFTMYGYATNTVDIPNITSRPHWNYIKTINANILPASTTCIPSDDLHRIRSVYDHGVTFWHNGDEIGDYSFDNSPIATNAIVEGT